MAIIVVVAVMLATSTIVMALQMYAFKISAGAGRTASLAWATLPTCSSVFVLRSVYYGLDTRDAYLNKYQQVRCAEYTLYANVIYGFYVPFIKAGVVFTLLRILPPLPLAAFIT
ncbi:hypothetical protein CMQ_1055 [Grosmannia clavigera kw1407]|uniref:Integral membrane protein n=1 Tax=Grosmannia clavigera (strain kw1407 / UAMH 11150) TaxID=655863 RepID=F0XCV3_GROCL|nr:uncharacterized protein CMQ_1055 [Grosmannia clavigera kw1407]EFX04127.1 hypothetical protein CMQ_1055 [Grosmannia clavigera kw1407]